MTTNEGWEEGGVTVAEGWEVGGAAAAEIFNAGVVGEMAELRVWISEVSTLTGTRGEAGREGETRGSRVAKCPYLART